jgi:hypothetical protein
VERGAARRPDSERRDATAQYGVPVGRDGALASEVLGITLRTVAGKLEITWDGGSATV